MESIASGSNSRMIEQHLIVSKQSSTIGLLDTAAVLN